MSGRWVDLREAAELLGASTEAVRKRAARGSLRADRQDGRVVVWVDEGRTEGGREAQVDREALLEAKEETIRTLREQLEAERRANEENRRLLAALIQRVPELEAPGGPPGAPETAAASEERKSPAPAVRGLRRAHRGPGGGECSVADPEDTERQQQEAIVEAHKLEFEVHKTQATLATGSILAILALAEILVPDEPRFLWLLGTSCLLLLYSITWALNSMFRLMTEVMVLLHPQRQAVASGDDRRQRGLELQQRSSMLSFSVAIGLFAGYVWFNVFV